VSKREAAGFGLSSIPTVVSAVAGAPWTAVIVVVVVTVLLVAIYKITQAVFPQDSADRLELLRGWLSLRDQRWRHKQLHRRRRPDPLLLQRICVKIVPPREEVVLVEHPTPPQDPSPGVMEAP
jgi:hypothetical protein